MKDIILKLENMSKSFGPTKAVQHVSLELQRGQIMALIGENGSGKSTLMSMVTGSLKSDEGTMFYKGEPYSPKSIIDAGNQGICILIQETGTINGLTVAENIFLGKESRFTVGVSISSRKLNEAAQELLDSVGAPHISAKQLIDELSFEERKLVEVCRALSNDPELLIVDETTTALSHTGREKIYALINSLKEQNKSVIFISHDLEEVQRVCDCAFILRDGQYIDTLFGEDVTPDMMRQRMIGRELSGSYYRDEKSYSTDESVLEVRDINYADVLHNISFRLNKGEILGLGGLTECGMHELCKVVFGAIKPDSGEVVLSETGVKVTSPSIAIKNHIAYLPKDRDQESVFLMTSIKDNITVTSLDNLKKGIFISPRSEKKLAVDAADELAVKMQNVEQFAKELSGGNKQKVVVAKWMANDSRIIIMDCPTRGIDIGVKATIYKLMEKLISEGKSIIMVSEELPELLGMSDRILIMKDGVINGQFSRSDNLTERMLIEKII
ncbi:MAG: sugar ABC transporter ATP-binding protein [Ruminococcaceae bacterium]|nr:sugar ABC transporter ATP-binding protein [Oscillospiraceae bacterium]